MACLLQLEPGLEPLSVLSAPQLPVAIACYAVSIRGSTSLAPSAHVNFVLGLSAHTCVMADELAQFSFSSAIRGHHVYMATWRPFTGEQLQAEREASNTHDRHAVAVIRVYLQLKSRIKRPLLCLCHRQSYHSRARYRCHCRPREKRAILTIDMQSLLFECTFSLKAASKDLFFASAIVRAITVARAIAVTVLSHVGNYSLIPRPF